MPWKENSHVHLYALNMNNMDVEVSFLSSDFQVKDDFVVNGSF